MPLLNNISYIAVPSSLTLLRFLVKQRACTLCFHAYRNIKLALTLVVLCCAQIATAQPLVPSSQTPADTFVVAVKPGSAEELPLNAMHQWELTLTDKEGAAITGLDIAISGGMEAHNHALPTQPQVRESEQAGVYVIRGLKFQMPGEWFVQLDTQWQKQPVVLRFDFEVMP